MNKEQLFAAQNNMAAWLADPHELGKHPYKLEPAGEFDYKELHYYIFKFKPGLLSKWRVGVCGGFEDDELEPCGHTFSEMKPFDPATAQDDCIAMVEMIRAYWMAQAEALANQKQ